MNCSSKRILRTGVGRVAASRGWATQKNHPNIAGSSEGSHQNPTDSDFDVEDRFPGQHGWRRICPRRLTNQTS
jgi:hypothetical protein